MTDVVGSTSECIEGSQLWEPEVVVDANSDFTPICRTHIQHSRKDKQMCT